MTILKSSLEIPWMAFQNRVPAPEEDEADSCTQFPSPCVLELRASRAYSHSAQELSGS